MGEPSIVYIDESYKARGKAPLYSVNPKDEETPLAGGLSLHWDGRIEVHQHRTQERKTDAVIAKWRLSALVSRPGIEQLLDTLKEPLAVVHRDWVQNGRSTEVSQFARNQVEVTLASIPDELLLGYDTALNWFEPVVEELQAEVAGMRTEAASRVHAYYSQVLDEHDVVLGGLGKFGDALLARPDRP